MQCKEKFLIQSVKVDQTALTEDFTREMFNKESVEEFKLRVIYHDPANYPAPLVVPDEGSENGSRKARTSLFDSVGRRIGLLWGGGSRKTQLHLGGEKTTSMSSSLKEPLLPN
ncbi:hypothetical protein MKX03_014909 [Papaver bracteatum]|nr:hypothetical protein MKX03_014909 [Papaver bracteatum]